MQKDVNYLFQLQSELFQSRCKHGQRTAVEFVFTSGTVAISVTQPCTLQAPAVTALVLAGRTRWHHIASHWPYNTTTSRFQSITSLV